MSSARILIVEDDSSLAEILAYNLREVGYDVSIASDGQQGLRSARNLHPDLVSSDAQRIIDIARVHGALGWKVNGAGGDGGSLTVLCDESSHSKRTMIKEIQEESPLFQNIPIYLSRFGLRIWETNPSVFVAFSEES